MARVALLLALLLCGGLVSVLGSRQLQGDALSGTSQSANSISLQRRKKVHPYTTPSGLFIQERASKQLPGPGQHFSFGALKPWEEILGLLQNKANRKLLLVVRHGQAISNFLSDTLGPDEWFNVEGTCQYDDKQGTVWELFDADLTDTGADQAKALNSMLNEAGWGAKLTGGKPTRAVVSPLTRCLHTATVVLQGLPINATSVEENVRETLGEDTCDARHSVSNPDVKHPGELQGPCQFDKGLRSMWPAYKFRVVDDSDERDGPRPFGLVSDRDTLWTKDKRERQGHQVRRAKEFLDILFEHAPEQVVFIITHSGFTRSLLLAARREPYRPVNAELVPVIVDKNEQYDADWADGLEELLLDERGATGGPIGGGDAGATGAATRAPGAAALQASEPQPAPHGDVAQQQHQAVATS